MKFFALAIVILGFSANSFGQASATATATGVIKDALKIEMATNMNFGDIYVDDDGGTVTVTPSATATNTGTGVITGGTPVAASFNVTRGKSSGTYAFTIPTAAISTTTNPVGAIAMTIDGWTSTPSSTSGAGTGTFTSGAQTIYVGATLHVGANQVAGTYSTGGFPVTVNYN